MACPLQSTSPAGLQAGLLLLRILAGLSSAERVKVLQCLGEGLNQGGDVSIKRASEWALVAKFAG
jgi:hypothetical protein